ncbi:MAG: cytochrome c3 family protein [Bacteroidales bacterium]|nr:cytochrome c3 family protein [Bacteroidales bacterium]
MPGFRFLLYITLISLSSAVTAGGFSFRKEKLKLQDTISFISPFEEDNERCFKCHGQERYEYTNENLGLQVKALMCTNRIKKREDFYNSNHKNFSCTDCHSGDYINFPHAGELRMEQKFNCIDCHGGDEKFAQFHFEEIESEYQQSTHFKLEADGFTCWKCHDPHSYRISIRNSENLKETILYNNTICLSCHSDFNRFQLLTDRAEINILQKHDWLPDQSSHFRSVRCIECHTKINDTILVAHLIQPKENAVKRCNECHSRNSMLMASLYKFQSKEQRRDGFFNGIILNESYVIGANRNKYLNILSLVIFGIVISIIGVHIYFRIIKIK